MFREQYASCNSCHVNPSGGGALTAYGRSLSEEVLSTWSYRGEAQPLHLDFGWPEWLAVGGDVRSVYIIQETEYEPEKRFIFMQRDVEVAVRSYGIWFAGSYGVYSERDTSKHHYVLFGDAIKFKFGKFRTSYGINTPDHTSYSRSAIGLGEGTESYNAEISTEGKAGQISITGILLTKEGEETYGTKNQGFATRITSYTTKWLQLGLSTMFLTESIKYGGYAMVGLWKRLYLSMDFNEVFPTGSSNSDVYGYSKASYEIYRGVNLTYENNYSKRAGKTGGNNAVGLDFFPRPHLQFLGKAIYDNEFMSYQLLSHYYF